MPEEKTLAHAFQDHRPRLHALAYRMLGGTAEADDALQEAWLRVTRADTAEVDNLPGWVTTVVSRVCLDALRSRKARREAPEPVERTDTRASVEDEHVLADSVGLALLAVLETLSPSERLAFVLHDTFDLPFDEIAGIVGCTPTAARQLASRARRRVRGAPAESAPNADATTERRVVEAFLLAARTGDLAGLLAVLDPDVVLRADALAVAGSQASPNPLTPRFGPELRGATSVASTFNGRARAAQAARVNGAAGAVWAPGGTPRSAFDFVVRGGKITRIDVIADPARLSRFEIEIEPD